MWVFVRVVFKSICPQNRTFCSLIPCSKDLLWYGFDIFSGSNQLAHAQNQMFCKVFTIDCEVTCHQHFFGEIVCLSFTHFAVVSGTMTKCIYVWREVWLSWKWFWAQMDLNTTVTSQIYIFLQMLINVNNVLDFLRRVYFSCISHLLRVLVLFLLATAAFCCILQSQCNISTVSVWVCWILHKWPKPDAS